MIKKVISVIVLFAFLSTPVYALESVEEYVTDEMQQNLPDDILIVEDNGAESINYGSLIDYIFDSFSPALENVLHNFLSVLSIVIVSAIFSALSGTVMNSGIKKCFSYIGAVCVAVILYGILNSVWNDMEYLLSKINTFVISAAPVTTLLYSLGGNLTTAAVNDSAMGIIITVFESICYHGIRPVLQICFGFCLVSCVSGSIDLKPIAAFVRKTYTTVLIFVMSFMTCVLTLQNMLTQGNDSLLLRTVKFASGLAVPLVGGTLGEATATVAKGVGAIRSTFGVLAIISLAVMVLPTLVSFWLNKTALTIGATVCSVFGISAEGELISGTAELLNFALAITASASVMFVIVISLLSNAVCAIGA